MTDQSGYLIERYYNGALHYWNGRPRDAAWTNSSDATDADTAAWTPKADGAVWFSNSDSAAVVLSWCLGGVGRVAEHMMIATAKADRPEGTNGRA